MGSCNPLTPYMVSILFAALSLFATILPANSAPVFVSVDNLQAQVTSGGITYTMGDGVRWIQGGYVSYCKRVTPPTANLICVVSYQPGQVQEVTQVLPGSAPFAADDEMIASIVPSTTSPQGEQIEYWTRSGSSYVGPYTVLAPDPEIGDSIGLHITMSQHYVVASADFGDDSDDGRGPNTGEVEVFERSGGALTWLQELRPSELRDSDYFGESIAVSDEWILVGSPGWDRASPPSLNVGRVYVYRRGSGLFGLSQIIEGSDFSSTTFGSVVAVNGDLALAGDRTSNQVMAFKFDPLQGWKRVANLTSNVTSYCCRIRLSLAPDLAIVPDISIPGTPSKSGMSASDPTNGFKQTQLLAPPSSACNGQIFSVGAGSLDRRGYLVISRAGCSVGGTVSSITTVYEEIVFWSSFE